MLGQGRGRCAVDQILILIRHFHNHYRIHSTLQKSSNLSFDDFHLCRSQKENKRTKRTIDCFLWVLPSQTEAHTHSRELGFLSNIRFGTKADEIKTKKRLTSFLNESWCRGRPLCLLIFSWFHSNVILWCVNLDWLFLNFFVIRILPHNNFIFKCLKIYI